MHAHRFRNSFLRICVFTMLIFEFFSFSLFSLLEFNVFSCFCSPEAPETFLEWFWMNLGSVIFSTFLSFFHILCWIFTGLKLWPEPIDLRFVIWNPHQNNINLVEKLQELQTTDQILPNQTFDPQNYSKCRLTEKSRLTQMWHRITL